MVDALKLILSILLGGASGLVGALLLSRYSREVSSPSPPDGKRRMPVKLLIVLQVASMAVGPAICAVLLPKYISTCGMSAAGVLIGVAVSRFLSDSGIIKEKQAKAEEEQADVATEPKAGAERAEDEAAEAANADAGAQAENEIQAQLDDGER